MHCRDLKLVKAQSRGSWWSLYLRCALVHFLTNFSRITKMRWRRLNPRTEGAVALLASFSMVDGWSKVVGPSGCLNSAIQKGVYMVERLTYWPRCWGVVGVCEGLQNNIPGALVFYLALAWLPIGIILSFQAAHLLGGDILWLWGALTQKGANTFGEFAFKLCAIVC